MKKLKKAISAVLILGIVCVSGQVFANNNEFGNVLGEFEYTQEFQGWLELSEAERKEVLQPRSFEIEKTRYKYTNPIRVASSLGSSSLSKFTLKKYIPENVTIKNQQETNSCWTFASLAMLESTLALSDYYAGNETIVYDFSERHMEYATSRYFKNEELNIWGFNRTVGVGGNMYLSRAYLLSGLGPVAEKEMPFENNENLIDLSEIKGKTVTAQIYDTVEFPLYQESEDKTELIKQMKEHIRKNGGIEAGIHGASLYSDYYNSETGAIYCDNSKICVLDHDVLIIGWDDDYPVQNFNESHRPKNNGAWIIKNSWGDKLEYTLTEMKEVIFQANREQCIQKGWNSAEEISDEFAIEILEKMGFTVQDDKVIQLVGDNGYMYVSYEDINIYTMLSGAENISKTVNYENIYQYDNFGVIANLPLNVHQVYLANVFDKKTTGKEYLSEVSVYVPETTTCKVFVNPNGESKDREDLIQVELKDGDSETFNAGYHTLELLNPIEIKSNKFAIVLELTGTRNEYQVPMEIKIDNTYFSVVQIENDKCFWTTKDLFNQNQWSDMADLPQISGGTIPAGDLSIKAFTISKVENELEEIEITTPPAKTVYTEGEDFDDTGMVVSAVYSNGTKQKITNYTIENGTDLKLDQTVVIIAYADKVATQSITVKEKETVPPEQDDGNEDSDDENEQKPETSNFEDVSANVEKVKYYYFTDDNQKEYITIELTLKDIEKSSKNDSYKYYYYLSSSPSKENITNWIEIKENQTSQTELEFTINTKDISNYEEVSKSNNLYLYIKEVVKINDKQEETITEAIKLETDGKIEIYKDNIKQTTQTDNNNSNNNDNNGNNSNSNNNQKDDTTANIRLPNTGLKMGIIFAILGISAFGIIKYIQYRRMNF